ncbi:sigma-70 family RNA polymerase sigma factor [Tenacibaculum larymnensis]|uniref:Sigma-70 family RNA polymerase sigma factor n=1 Tax=Tenacibaculum larymnensis TaxID=2878201 RepID=A0A9X4EWX3_9FLAO|nr:sigma-70 family RNA polymerase sigma factor [Tenacibaculum larymnensis]MDE1207931.1 sigma-70 family RNA polymerase sigma factor [Tenacibaculum larymnensis]
MKNTKINYQQREFHIFVAQAFPLLIKSKEEGDKETFNTLILKILPSIKKYVNQRLVAAISKGHFPKNKYNANDFIDQLFVEVYENINEVKKADNFYLWLFKKADQLLENTIEEEEFDELFFKNIDDFSKPEWNEMEEKFSADAEGDLLMMDELDDSSYHKNNYTLNHVFVKDEEQNYIDKLDKELDETTTQRHIQMILHKLPTNMQSVFELSSEYKFNLDEISTIKGITKEKISKLIEDTRSKLRKSFFSRYLS